MGLLKSLIGAIVVSLIVLVIITLNFSIFLIYSPDPSTEHYLHVKTVINSTSTTATNVNATSSSSSNLSHNNDTSINNDDTNTPTMATKAEKVQNVNVQYFNLPYRMDQAIAYEMSGPEDGYTVFMMHDLPGSKSWRHVNESTFLEQHKIRLVRFDRLGFGQSATNRLLLEQFQLQAELAKQDQELLLVAQQKQQQASQEQPKNKALKKNRSTSTVGTDTVANRKLQQRKKVQAQKQKALREKQKLAEASVDRLGTFMTWFQSFLNNDGAQAIDFTVAQSVENEFVPFVNHVLKGDPNQHFSLIGYGMGSPFALAALSSSLGLSARIDAVSLLAPFGQPTSSAVDTSLESCFIHSQVHKWVNMESKEFGGYRSELALRAIWNAASKFGFVTHHDQWPRLFHSCFTADDRQLLFQHKLANQQGNSSINDGDSNSDTTPLTDQWLNIFNRTMIDLYMQGTNNHLNQLIALMKPGGWGFDPSHISAPSTHIQFVVSDTDPFAPLTLAENLYNSLCGSTGSSNGNNDNSDQSGTSSGNQCAKHLASGIGHFALFDQHFNQTLSFISRHASRPSEKSNPLIDPKSTVPISEETKNSEMATTTSQGGNPRRDQQNTKNHHNNNIKQQQQPKQRHQMMKKISSAFLTKTPSSSSDSAARRIIIVGTGLAGYSAAIEAVKYASSSKQQHSGGGNSLRDVKVLMLDKEDRIGGNSAKASSGMNALSDHDNAEHFYSDVIKSGGGLSNESLVHILVDQSREALEFLTRVAHVDMSVVSQCGGHSHERTWRNHVDPSDQRPKNVGFEIISKMNQLVTSDDEDKDLKENVQIVNGAKVVGFLTASEDNDDSSSSSSPTVIGVKTVMKNSDAQDEQQLYADAVILATGGYGQDRQDLLSKYAPNWMQNLPSTNGAFSTGDMIKVVHEQLGGQMVHMDQIQVHPTGFINPADPNSKTVFLAAEALRAYGGVLLNQQGHRFTNELGTRDRVTQDILANCTNEGLDFKWSYLVLNQYVVDGFGKNLMQFYISKGFFTTHQNAEHFAEHYQLDASTVRTTLEEYNKHVETKSADQFGKTLFPTKLDLNETLYVARITPSIHYTMGGLKFDSDARVLNETDQPIKGLYAAGEVTGSLHGKNRLAGNSLLETVVFGRISGRSAVEAK